MIQKTRIFQVRYCCYCSKQTLCPQNILEGIQKELHNQKKAYEFMVGKIRKPTEETQAISTFEI